ncbi:MAG: cytochrome c oxidase subunit 3 [Candidatus Obscuribacterales bacterium]|nr:cytochrome c oxidase subunit 3 [Steroidobacteraceae bacterium]
MAHAHTDHAAADKYYVPHGSIWPIFGSVALFCTMIGASMMLNHSGLGGWVFSAGLVLVITMFIGWFGTVISESEGHMYNAAVDRSFRMGMLWFIFSEVMFFAAFFGALYYARSYSIPWLGGEGTKPSTNLLLWNNFESAWPTNGPAEMGGDFETIPWSGVPLINTLILLTSGITITIAHHALKAGSRKMLNIFLAATFLLGYFFVYMQAEEYIEAYQHLNLTLGSGIYGSTFFMLTGFHGFHVTLGAIMLTVIWFRCIRGHFTSTHHFAFEGVAWYWHFVDVVWLGLYVFVYVL